MIPELIAALILIGFLAGCLFCWPIAQRRGELKAMRRLEDWSLNEDEWGEL